MSYVKDIVTSAIANLTVSNTFRLARFWETQERIDDLEENQLPLIVLDNLTISSNGNVQPNFNYSLNHQFFIRAFDKFENGATDEEKEIIVDELTDLLLSLHGEIYKLAVVNSQDTINFTITPIPEIYAGNYTGVQMQMNIAKLNNITACE